MLLATLIQIGCLAVSALLAAGLIQPILLPYCNLPTRQDEAVTPQQEMLSRYRRYTCRSACVTVAYTVAAIVLWNMPDKLGLLAPLAVFVVLITCVFQCGVFAQYAGIKRRIREGTYGMNSEALRKYLRQL